MKLARAIPASFDRAIVAAIDRRLEKITDSVAVPLAVESGSRAWGFPSPDSDYDCRFIFVRPGRDYLTLWPKRDVIETPLDHVLDVNGWDVSKALKLAVAGNAVVLEWLRSPVLYRADRWFREALSAFCQEHAPAERVRAHYLHLGLRQLSRAVDNAGTVASKKLFYVLRPALALRWMRVGRELPPMDLHALIAVADLPASLQATIERLVARKAITRELGRELAPAELLRFADAEFARARDSINDEPPSLAARDGADLLFRDVVNRFSAGWA